MLFFSSTFVSQVSFALCLHVCMHIRDDWFAWCKWATPVSLLFLFPTFYCWMCWRLLPPQHLFMWALVIIPELRPGYWKRGHVNSFQFLRSGESLEWGRGEWNWHCVVICVWMCAGVCVLLVLTTILMSLINAINSLTWMEVWTSFTHIMWSTAKLRIRV